MWARADGKIMPALQLELVRQIGLCMRLYAK
jgi:hypothetical protein